MDYTFSQPAVTGPNVASNFSLESALDAVVTATRTSRPAKSTPAVGTTVGTEDLGGIDQDYEAAHTEAVINQVHNYCIENFHLQKDLSDSDATNSDSLFLRYGNPDVRNHNAGMPTASQIGSSMVELVRKCGVPEASVESTAALACRALYGQTTYGSPRGISCMEGPGGNRGVSWGDYMTSTTLNAPISLESYMSEASASALSSWKHENNRYFNMGTEAFGTDVNHIPVDNRLNMSLTIERPKTSFMDRAFARVPCKNGHIVIDIPYAEVYNLDQSNSQNPQVRNNAGVILNTLFKNPTMVNTQPQQVVPVLTNDIGTPKVLIASTAAYGITDTTYLCTGVEANLFTLTNVQNRLGYEATNFTDLICEGGKISAVLLKVTSGTGSDAVTEVFNVPTHFLQTSQFQRTNNSQSSFDLSTNFSVVTTLRAGSTTASGATSTILSQFTDSLIQIDIKNISPVLDINTGVVTTGQPMCSMQLLPAAGQSAVPAAQQTAYNNLQANISVIGMQIKLYFDEENLRKTNLAVRVLRNQYTFTVPQGRTVIVDFALQQQDDQETLKTTTTVTNLGNSIRQFTILQNELTDTYNRITWMQNNPEITKRNVVPRLTSITAPVILPAVGQATINLNDGKSDNMNEAQRLPNTVWRVMEALYFAIQQIEAQTLLNTQREAGQTGIYKCLTHNTIRGMLFGIRQYYTTLEYPGTKNTGADLSFGLPNGYQLDVVGTNFQQLQNKMILCPVDQRNPSHWTSTATIQDAASYTAVFPYTRMNATSRRIIHNSREILFVPTPVGIIVELQGLEAYINAFNSAYMNFDIASYNTIT